MDAQSDKKLGQTKSGVLEMRLLGAPKITLDGTLVAGLTSAKARALLFYLAVTGRAHTRLALAGLMWGDFPEAAARANLRKALQKLRAHFEAYMDIERDTVALAADADTWVDAVEFGAVLQEMEGSEDPERIQRAVDLYQGDFLEGFYVRNAPDFENWSLSERARLREMMLEGLDALADHRAAEGDLDTAIALTRRILDLEPWREEGHRRLMTWLATSGQRGAALAQYEVCSQVLADELGVEPAPETTTLYERIRDGDLRPRPRVVAARPLSVKPQRPAFLDKEGEAAVGAPEPFVGREPQMARLAGFLETALAGRGRMAFVSGEAGWGKTRLLTEFARQAQDDHGDLIVASGICTTFTGTGDPYLPFREMLRELSADVEQDWSAGVVTRGHALRLWHALPEVIAALVARGPDLLGTLIAGGPLLRRAAAHDGIEPELLRDLQDLASRGQAGRQVEGIDQEHIFEEATDVLQVVSQRHALLLIIDDLHWADVSSVNLLFHLSRQFTRSPILIVGAYRPEEVALGRDGKAHPLAGLLDEVKRLLGDVWVRLGEEEDQGRRFVDALLDSEPNSLDADFRDQLARSTRGHPLFAVETLRHLEEHGHIYKDEAGEWVAGRTITWDTLPQRVEGVIERRIHRLDPGLGDVLTTASVEGEEFTAEVLARVRGVGAGEVVGLLSGELAKRHHLVRATGVQRLGERRISRYRFSHNLFQRHLYNTLDAVEQSYLHEAIGEAMEAVYRGSTEEVAGRLARHFQEAGRLGKAVGYLEQAGDAASRAYANTEAIAHYEQAVDLAQRLDIEAEELTDLYLRLGRTLELNSDYEEALGTYEEMEALARQRDDRAMVLSSLMAQITIHAIPSAVHDAEAALALGEPALMLSRELDDQVAEARILWALSVAGFFGGRHAEGISHGERSLALARELGLREQMAHTLNDLGGLLYLYTGRISRAIKALEEAGDLWDELGNKPMLADSLSGASTAHTLAGAYDQAIALSDRAFEISQSIGNPWGQSYSRWKVGLAFWERGEMSQAIRVMEESIQLAELVGLAAPQTSTRADLAALYGELGAAARGMETAQTVLSAAGELGYLPDRVSALAILAHLHALKGEHDEARARIEEARADPERSIWLFTVVTAGVAEGEMTLQQEDYEQCVTATDALLTYLRQTSIRLYLPQALLLKGSALLGLGEQEAARDVLSEARAVAEAIGSRRTLWRILQALSQIEEEPAEAEALREGAREVIGYIVDHIDEMAMRALFLSKPEVRAVLKPVDS